MKGRTRITAGAVLMAASFLLGSLAVSTARADDTADVYTKKCATCHGVGGKGDGPASKVLKPPPGDFTATLKGMSDDDIARMIKEGGKALGKSASMPAYGGKLSDEQIKSLVQHVKALCAK